MERVGDSLDDYTTRTLVLNGTEDSPVHPSVSGPLGALPSVDRKVYRSIKHGSIDEPRGVALLNDIITRVREQVRSGLPKTKSPEPWGHGVR